jgi:spore maturation protein CgeB
LQKAFLNSKICLGFNSDENIKNGLPTERTFEGIAYGCVVLTDCKMAEEAIPSNTVYVKDYEDLQRQVDFYLNNESARKKKQKEGYEYALNKGTYYTVAKNFLNSIEQLYGNQS